MEKIVCPICGQEYMPVEIYLPNEFFGHPDEVVKNDAGKVDFVLGKDMNLDETYECDNCGCVFSVHTDLTFTTNLISEKKSFEEEYVTKFERADRIELAEENLFNA